MKENVRPPQALRELRRHSLASRAKPYLRDIDRQVEDGAPLEEAIAGLAEKGIQVSKLNLKQMLYRERRLWRQQAAAGDHAGPGEMPVPKERVVPQAPMPRPAAPAAIETSAERFAAALDPKKRSEFADKYVNTKPPLFAAKAQGENQ